MSVEAPKNDRFHQLVGELEVQNERLSRRIASLCRSFSHCTLALDGRSESVDELAGQLRERLKIPTADDLEDSVSHAVDTLVERSKAAASSDKNTDNPLQVLLDHLLEMGVPAAHKARIQNLLDEVQTGATDANKLAMEFLDLMRCQGDSPSKGGLLQRLFRSDDADNGQDQASQDLLAAALLDLMDKLVLPADLTTKAVTIQERLRSKSDREQWREIIESVAALFTEMRSAMDAEIRSFESFLSSLTQRLQGLDRDLGGAQGEDDSSRDDRQRLDDAVQAEVREIAKGVDASKELSQLKSLVSQRLDILCEHLEARREHETQRAIANRERIEHLTGRLHELESESKQLHEHIREARSQALRDPLTGAFNRLAYNERIVQEYARWKRFDEGLSVIICDVDHFKSINDRFGHKAGDKALQLIVRILGEQLRETDFLARYGGEEFVILLPGASKPAASGVADKLRGAVERAKFHFNKQRISITLSCGIAYFKEGDEIEAPLVRADKALYSAKQAGRNRCVWG